MPSNEWKSNESAIRLHLANVAIVVMTASFIFVLTFYLSGHIGFSLWDPGYLWYGVERVLAGEVPVRDFASYDIGRYYWAAALMEVLHLHGFSAVRAVSLAFSSIGVAIAGVFVYRALAVERGDRKAVFVFSVCLFALWLVPWWKGYDITASIVLVVSLKWVIDKCTPLGWFAFGVVLGLVAVLGRNHGVYGVLAACGAMGLLWIRRTPVSWMRCIGAWIGGIVLGYLPVILDCVLRRGFFKMFWYNTWSILLTHGTTNLYLPIPWPWRTRFVAGVSPVASVRELFVGICFIAIIAFSLFGIIFLVYAARKYKRSKLAAYSASVCVAIPYLNVAFSRADVSHLCQAIFPALIGCMVFPFFEGKRHVGHWSFLFIVLCASLVVTLPVHSAYRRSTEEGWSKVDVRGDVLWVAPATARMVSSVKDISERCLRHGDTVLAAPTWPGIYALLDVRAPVWDIYPTVSRGGQFQDTEIARLDKSKPVIALINDVPIDGRTDLLYKYTHPGIWKYIANNYREVDVVGMPSMMRVFISDRVQCKLDLSLATH